MAQAQIDQIRSELDYLEGQMANLSNCTEENELLEIREELIREGYVRRRRGASALPKSLPPNPCTTSPATARTSSWARTTSKTTT